MTRYKKMVALSLTGFILAALPAMGADAPSLDSRIEALYRLSFLPKRKPFEAVGCVSSYDPTGGNDDGFSGKHSFIRKEDAGFVIAEFKGPGVITRFLMSRPTDGIIQFFFDGEAAPRIRMKIPELFDGDHAPFLAPMVGTEAGGRYSYVPLPFQRSCKIVVQSHVVHFFQINHARYPENTAITTYASPPSKAYLDGLAHLRQLFLSTGRDISARLVSEGTPITRQTRRVSLKPGETMPLFETSRPGRIVGLKLGPASVFAGHDRAVLLQMHWDGGKTPAVSCPVGDFFGYSFGKPAVRSLLLGTAADVNYCYLPMPFERSARIALISERTEGPPIAVTADIALAPLGKAPDEGRFYAHWHRENPTRQGRPFTFLKAKGWGHVIGIILQAQGLTAGHTGFFEGDDLAVIDGRTVARGTGSEETFNGGWYDVPGRWENRVSLPLSGCLEYKKYLGRTGGYRWMIADTYPFQKSIDFSIEHGPEGNRIPTDYTGMTYFYAFSPLAMDPNLPVATDRRVSPPRKIIFVPGWNVPVRTFSLQNATLTKAVTPIQGRNIRHLSFKPSGRAVFPPHHISFLCEMPAAGRYRVGLKALCGPDQGIVQLFRHDRPFGPQVNLYDETKSLSELLSLGTLDLLEGDNVVFIALVGKDTRAKGQDFDAVELIFEAVGDG